MTREKYEALALERLAELARSENERIALEAARTLLAHLRLTLPPRRQGAENERSELSIQCSGVPKTEDLKPKTDMASCSLGDLAVEKDVERAREHVLRAMDRCAGLLEHENPFVVLRAAREILQHYRHLCRERFKWTAWSEVREGRDRKRRGVAARAKVKDLGRELAGIRKDQGDMYRKPAEGGTGTCPPTEESDTEPWEEEFEGAEEYRLGPPPIDWGDDPDERAPP